MVQLSCSDVKFQALPLAMHGAAPWTAQLPTLKFWRLTQIVVTLEFSMRSTRASTAKNLYGQG